MTTGVTAEQQALSPNEHARDEAWPFFADDEIAAVADVMRSGKVNQWAGTKVRAFEDAYKEYIASGRAIALANGSLALELALRSLGIGPGDEVIVTPRTFVASAFCAMLVGAVPIFADVDRDSGNITPDTIRAVLTPRTRAIVPVHLAGWPADMPGIMALARDKGLLVIEDCAQAHGAETGGRPVGSFGDAATFSFCQDKIISTGGEGGLLVLHDEAAFEWAWSFKDHGKNRKKAFAPQLRPGFRWFHDSVGTNWRMTEISAVIGMLQLQKLETWRALRTRNAMIWADALREVPRLRVPLPTAGSTGAFYKLYAYVDGASGSTEQLRDKILAALAGSGLKALSGSCPEIYREAAFDGLAVPVQPVAKELGEASLMFEVHPTLDVQRLRERAATVARLAASVLA